MPLPGYASGSSVKRRRGLQRDVAAPQVHVEHVALALVSERLHLVEHRLDGLGAGLKHRDAVEVVPHVEYGPEHHLLDDHVGLETSCMRGVGDGDDPRRQAVPLLVVDRPAEQQVGVGHVREVQQRRHARHRPRPRAVGAVEPHPAVGHPLMGWRRLVFVAVGAAALGSEHVLADHDDRAGVAVWDVDHALGVSEAECREDGDHVHSGDAEG
jgi:hypothetical protein